MGTSYFKKQGTKNELAGYLPSDAEIDKETAQAIREKYTGDDEAKLHRTALSAVVNGTPLPVDYVEYEQFVELQVRAGRAKKQEMATKLAGMTIIEIETGNGETQIMYVEA